MAKVNGKYKLNARFSTDVQTGFLFTFTLLFISKLSVLKLGVSCAIAKCNICVLVYKVNSLVLDLRFLRSSFISV